MACCIIAALIMAQIMATVRRWGVFWGVVSPHEGEQCDTIYHRIARVSARPRVRAVIFTVMAIEMMVLAGWITIVHGSHLYRLGDQAIGRLTGQNVVYAGVCDRNGADRFVRIVLVADNRPT